MKPILQIYISIGKVIFQKISTLTLIASISLTNFNCTLSETIQTRQSRRVRTIEQVLEESTPRLMLIPGVVGTAIGECDDQPCIKILLVELSEELEMKLPKRIENYPVFIEETREIRAY